MPQDRSLLLASDHVESGAAVLPHWLEDTLRQRAADRGYAKPLKLKASNPQDSDLTIVDLQSLKTSHQLAFRKGIFGVEFLKTKPLLLVGTEAGELVDFASGKSMPSPPNHDFGPEAFPRGSCDDFKSKSYRRYKEWALGGFNWTLVLRSPASRFAASVQSPVEEWHEKSKVQTLGESGAACEPGIWIVDRARRDDQ